MVVFGLGGVNWLGMDMREFFEKIERCCIWIGNVGYIGIYSCLNYVVKILFFNICKFYFYKELYINNNWVGNRE